MSKVLGSIKNLDEAKTLLDSAIDIIDLKDPSKGALNLQNQRWKLITLEFINKKKLTSSTVGDLPNDESIITDTVQDISETNVDFIKIGVYGKNYIQTLCKIRSSKKLIAVFFADKFLPDQSNLEILKKSGFSGVMIDTCDKMLGNLFDHISLLEIEKFLSNTKKINLISGIAGSIKSEHLDRILELNPTYIGFRGALCEDNQLRGSSISKHNVESIVSIIKKTTRISANA